MSQALQAGGTGDQLRIKAVGWVTTDYSNPRELPARLCLAMHSTTGITGLMETTRAFRNFGRERDGSGNVGCLGVAEADQ